MQELVQDSSNFQLLDTLIPDTLPLDIYQFSVGTSPTDYANELFYSEASSISNPTVIEVDE
jgi:hypothetical protein